MNSIPKLFIIGLIALNLIGCAGYSKVVKQKTDLGDQATTPRDIMNARIVNRSEESEHPFLTVGKFVELADRYQSCQCTDGRFVRRWEKTTNGYLLHSYFNESRPIEFVCNSTEKDVSCYIKEIDRGGKIKNLNERFAPASSLVKFIYDNGVKCEEINPCG